MVLFLAALRIFLAIEQVKLNRAAATPGAGMGDEQLADAAVTNPNALAALLGRAAGGSCRNAAYVVKNPATAVYWYEKAVALDDQGAERMLGFDYFYGSGVPQDYGQAAQLMPAARTLIGAQGFGHTPRPRRPGEKCWRGSQDSASVQHHATYHKPPNPNHLTLRKHCYFP